MKRKFKELLIALAICVANFALVVGMNMLNPANPLHAAENTYKIANGEMLKSWLTDADGLQTDNPNAELINNITIDWGNTCAPNESIIMAGSTLNGGNYTITIAGANATIGQDTKQSNFSAFSRWCDGVVENVNFVTGGDITFSIDNTSARDNSDIYTGFVFSEINGGKIKNCSVEVKHNISYITPSVAFGGGSGDHFGILAGTIRAGAVVEFVKIKLYENATIFIKIDRGMSLNYIRGSMVCADAYGVDANVPLFKNIEIERLGKFNFYQNSSTMSTDSMIYGNLVADLNAGGTGGTHALNVDGVIYSGIGGALNNGLTFEGKSGTVQGYMVGRRGSQIFNNVYSYVKFDSENTFQQDGGVTYIPQGCTVSFDNENENNVIITKSGLAENEFVWGAKYEKVNEISETFSELSNVVSVPKHNADKSLPTENMEIVVGTIKNEATFGFESAELIYTGKEHTATFNVEGEHITTGFVAEYKNNLNSFKTTGTKASASFQCAYREDGVFLKDNYYFVYKKNIKMGTSMATIKPAPLSLTYTEGDVYTNNLHIEGLVNGEQITIEETGYGNGDIQLNCLQGSTVKTIEFNVPVLATNYEITKQNINNNFEFVISAHEVVIDENIEVLGVEGTYAELKNNKLLIYTKNYQEIKLKFNQPEGYLNKTLFKSSNGTDYNVNATYNEQNGEVTYSVKEFNNNDFQFLTEIVLEQSYKQVALKFEVSEIELINEFLVNNETPVEFGEYFAYSVNYKNQVVLNISLKPEYEESYEIQVFVNGEQVSLSTEGFVFEAVGNINNIMNVKIEIVSK